MSWTCATTAAASCPRRVSPPPRFSKTGRFSPHAGALQDRRRAEVVGTRTFGKGVFQQVIELSNGGALDITAGQYFTPSGRNLGGKGVSTGSGIQPDVKATDDPKTAKRDEAKDRALAVLA